MCEQTETRERDRLKYTEWTRRPMTTAREFQTYDSAYSSCGECDEDENERKDLMISQRNIRKISVRRMRSNRWVCCMSLDVCSIAVRCNAMESVI